MRTGEYVANQGLYASRCCNREQPFEEHEIFQRCPACNSVCEWELEEEVVHSKKTKRGAA